MKCLYGECPPKEQIRREKKEGIQIGEIILGETYLISQIFFPDQMYSIRRYYKGVSADGGQRER